MIRFLTGLRLETAGLIILHMAKTGHQIALVFRIILIMVMVNHMLQLLLLVLTVDPIIIMKGTIAMLTRVESTKRKDTTLRLRDINKMVY